MNRIIAEINKKSGENIIGRMSDMESVSIERIPTGIAPLDDAVGGGFPKRRIIELYGLPSGGKSLISMLIIKSAQEKGLECVYIDIEDSFDPIFAAKLGVDIKKLILMQSSMGEDVFDTICKILPANPGVIVVDSVAAMLTRGESEESVEKIFMAPKARLMSKGLPKINALNKDTMIVFINQLRATMVMYGAPTTTTGGRALGHYASIRVEVKQTDKIYEDDKKTKDVIGQIVGFNVTKNKTASPWKRGSFKFIYDGCKMEW